VSVVNYPDQWQRVAQTLDGVEYRIRPIRVEDLQREKDFIMSLSEESRYTRMMCAMREPSAALLDRFVHVDYHHDMAFVALVGEPENERIIGVARYAADANGTDCEFAVAVTDAWQARGVGATLTRLLFDYARSEGFHKLHGDIMVGNQRMIELVHWLGMKTQRSPNDGTLLEASREP
jgi:acetyltransferase